MVEIAIVAECTILTKDNPHDTNAFQLELEPEQGIKAEVTVDFSSEILSVRIDEFQISEGLSDRFRNDFSVRLTDYSEEHQSEIGTISSFCTNTARRILSFIKYHLQYFDISEKLFSIKSRKWKFSDSEWKAIPMEIHASYDFRNVPKFDDRTVNNIQNALDQEWEPLLALRHLHRAKNETIAHYKWIDATIAAELAIKEALIRCKPDLEVLLLEVPAPPLHKLYGIILETYLGERSPYLKIISKGVETRNRLVHRPTYEKVNDQEAIDYVNNIEKVIVHLMWLLYPKSEIVCERWRLIGR